MKQTIKLRESELRRMIVESVKRVLKETEDYDWDGLDQISEKSNQRVEELIQNTLNRLPGKALHADAYVVPIIRGAIKRAYDLGCTECNINN